MHPRYRRTVPSTELTISSARVVAGANIGPARVTVRGGLIAGVTPGARATADLDLGDLVLMPGLVDTHVHINEPGRTDWEGFATASRAAAAGGTTTFVVMPLNCSPVATTAAALREEAAAAAKSCIIDHGLWGGIIPGNQAEIEPMWDAGALGFKCFMTHSGIDEFPNVARADLERAFPILARLGATLLVHAESPEILAAAAIPADLAREPRSYRRYLASRPPQSEDRAIETIIELCRAHGARAHIVHVASRSALPPLAAAKREGLPITAETCPHYLALSAEDIADGATAFKCAPPVREDAHREALWDAIKSGTLDLIASDHSPCPPDLKLLGSGDFARAWGGISSLQLSLPLVWTQAHRRGFDLSHLARWLCEGPARLAGLGDRKGRIAPGFDADLVAFDPEAEFTVDDAALEHRHKLTPYHGRTLRGVVRKTFLRGRVIFDSSLPEHSRFPDGARGRWLKRTAHNPISPHSPS